MTHTCKYPSCRQLATHTWALVPVCQGHHEAIRAETVRYYRRNGELIRVKYARIRKLTPWG